MGEAWRHAPSAIQEEARGALGKPKVEADKLRDAELKDCYKIKLTSAGYRLVYRVDDPAVTVRVVTVGKRNRGIAYEAAKRRRRP